MLRCPRCGREPLVTQERILGYAPVVAIGDDGSLDFAGETELVWEESVSDADPASGETLLFCRNGRCPNCSGVPVPALRRQLLGGPPTSPVADSPLGSDHRVPARPAPGCGRDVRW